MQPLYAPVGEKKVRELVPEATYTARIYRLLTLGEQETMFTDEVTGEPISQFKIDVTFELPYETRDFGKGEQPMVISKEYTLSFNEKATLRKLINSIEGKALTDAEAVNYDILSIIGKAVQIQVVHKTSKAGNERAEVSNTLGLSKGMVCPPQVNGSQILTFQNWSEELFLGLPQFMREKIEKSQEYQTMRGTYKPKFELPKVAVKGVSPTDTTIDYGDTNVNVDDIPF